MADRTELAFLKNALSARALDPQEQTALENLMFQRLVAGNLQIDVNGQITGGGLATGPSTGPPTLVTLLDGTVGAPSLSFLNEPTTGRYRPGPGDVGESVLGARVLDWSLTRLQLTNINLVFANDTVNDIGAAGANRPRDVFIGRNAAVGGTLNAAGATTLGGTLNVGGTTTDSGALLFSPDLTYDIGASGATRPRNLFLGNNAVIGGTLNVTGTTVVGGTLTLTVPLPGSSGGTGTAYFTVVGPTAPRTYTFPDANATVLTTNAAVTVPQGGTGVSTINPHGVMVGEGTNQITSTSAGVQGALLVGRGGGTDPAFVLPSATGIFAGTSISAANRIYGYGGAGWGITPATSGRVLLMANGYCGAGVAANYSFRLYFGTGAAPSSGSALTGTAAGGEIILSLSSNWSALALVAVVTGLVIGTGYWCDIAVIQNPGAAAVTTQMFVVAHEI